MRILERFATSRARTPSAPWWYAATLIVALVPAALVGRWFRTDAGLSLWYPTAAILYATFVLYGPALWPVLVAMRLATVFLLIPNHAPVHVVVLTTMLGTTCYAVPAVVVRRLGVDARLTRRRDAVLLLGWGALGALGAACCTLAARNLLLNRSWVTYLTDVNDFALGDGAAVLTMSPLLILAGMAGRRERSAAPRRWVLRPAGVVGAVLVAAWLSARPGDAGPQYYPLVIVIVLLALRVSVLGAAQVVAVGAVAATAFAWRADLTISQMRSLEQFLVVLGAAGALLATHEMERRTAQSAREDTERALQGSEQRLRLLVDSTVDHALYTLDAAGVIDSWNAGGERLFGYRAEDIVGRHVSALTVDTPAVVDAELAVARGPVGRVISEGVKVRADGTRFWGRVVRAPLRDDTGQLCGFGNVVQDLTAQRQAVQSMADARDAALAADAAKSTFLATISHEIRTPMNAVIGMTGLLRDTDLSPVQREFVDTIRTAGSDLLLLINEILDFSKIEAGELDLEAVPFDVHAAVEVSLDLVAATAAGKGLELIGRVDPGCPARVVGDVTRFRQVLANLLSNAVKFTSAGEVEVVVSGRPARGSDDVELTVSVRDTGVGIPPSALGRLFDPFSQVDASTTRVYGGTGLGLAICRRLVTAMGGELTVHSVPGEGSEFVFTVLVSAAPADAPLATVGLADPVVARGAVRLPRPRVAADVAPRRPLRILYAEDNPTNQRVGRLTFAKLGHEAVDVVSSGADAVAAVYSRPYDLILMDVQMPIMDGLTAARQIRAADLPQPRIVALTAGARETDRAACLAAGMDGYLTKPIETEALRLLFDEVAVACGVVGPAPVASRMAELADQLELTETDLAAFIVRPFLSDATEQFAALDAAVHAGSLSDIAATAHVLRSSTAQLGAAELAAALGRLEDLARDGAPLDDDVTTVQVLAKDALADLDRWARELEDVITHQI